MKIFCLKGKIVNCLVQWSNMGEDLLSSRSPREKNVTYDKPFTSE